MSSREWEKAANERKCKKVSRICACCPVANDYWLSLSCPLSGSLPKLSNLNEFQWKKIIRNNSFIAHGEKSLAHHRPERTQRHAKRVAWTFSSSSSNKSPREVSYNHMEIMNEEKLLHNLYWNYFQSRRIPLSSSRGAEMKVQAMRAWAGISRLHCVWFDDAHMKKRIDCCVADPKKATADSETNSKIIREATKIKTSIMTFSLMKEKWMKRRKEKKIIFCGMNEASSGRLNSTLSSSFHSPSIQIN